MRRKKKKRNELTINMIMTEFKNRVFGCVAVKAINSNYNADFSGQPRTLPNGKVFD